LYRRAAGRYDDRAVHVVAALVIGAGLLLVGLASLFRADRMVLALLARTPPSAVDGIEPGPARLDGTVVPSEQGLAREPISGTDVVWYRIAAQWLDVSPDGERRTWRDLFTERDSRDFDLADDADRRARIRADDAGFVLAGDQFGGRPEIQVLGFSVELRQAALTPELDRWVRARTDKTPETIRVQRWMLAPGARVSALGVAAPGGDEVRLEPHPAPGEVVVTDVDSATLESILAQRRRNRRILTALGVPMILAGVALLLV
jgi:hypothetical protein